MILDDIGGLLNHYCWGSHCLCSGRSWHLPRAVAATAFEFRDDDLSLIHTTKKIGNLMLNSGRVLHLAVGVTIHQLSYAHQLGKNPIESEYAHGLANMRLKHEDTNLTDLQKTCQSIAEKLNILNNTNRIIKQHRQFPSSRGSR